MVSGVPVVLVHEKLSNTYFACILRAYFFDPGAGKTAVLEERYGDLRYWGLEGGVSLNEALGRIMARIEDITGMTPEVVSELYCGEGIGDCTSVNDEARRIAEMIYKTSRELNK